MPLFRPVTQTRTGYGRGNCTEATIASLLGVGIEEVPDIWAGPGTPDDAPPGVHQPPEKMAELWRWLLERHGVVEAGMKLTKRNAGIPAHLFHAEGWPTVEELFPVHIGSTMQPDWAVFHMMVGPNPDGVSHAIIGHRGIPVWDPNPLRRGITHCHSVYFLVPVDLIPSGCAGMPSIEWRLNGTEEE
jgi:hypothetical protein